MKWYVLRYDINTRNIQRYNVLNDYFIDDIKTNIKKKKIKDRDELKEYLTKQFRCNFWCKSEHEVLIGGLFSDINEFEKIDIYYQLEPNISTMADYIWQNLGEINEKKKNK